MVVLDPSLVALDLPIEAAHALVDGDVEVIHALLDEDVLALIVSADRDAFTALWRNGPLDRESDSDTHDSVEVPCDRRELSHHVPLQRRRDIDMVTLDSEVIQHSCRLLFSARSTTPCTV